MQADIYIIGEITSTSLQKVMAQVQSQDGFDSLLVHINSPGGNVTDGYAIRDYLFSQRVPVTTRATGQCSSIATAIFLAGSQRQVMRGCLFLVHLPSGSISGTADFMDSYVRMVKKVESDLIDFYVQSTGIDKQLIIDMMRNETVLSPEQLVEYGFATNILEPVKALATFNLPAEAAQKPMDTKKRSILNRIMALFADVTALALTLADGTSINIETEGDMPGVGNMVTFKETSLPVPDGTHELSDGKKIVTIDGKITEIIQPVLPQNEMTQEQAQKLIEENKSLSEKVAALEARHATEIQASVTFRKEVQDMLKTITSKGTVTRDEPIVVTEDTNLSVEEQWTKRQQEKKAKK